MTSPTEEFLIGEWVYFPVGGEFVYNSVRYEDYEAPLAGKVGRIDNIRRIKIRTGHYLDGTVKERQELTVVWDGIELTHHVSDLFRGGFTTGVDATSVRHLDVSDEELLETYKRLGVTNEDKPE